jgi:GNAT superfamily N-acetyltransferase
LLFGSDSARAEKDDGLLDPVRDAARIRAFFVNPDFARRGIGRALLEASESAIITANFSSAELVATLAGEPLYAAFAYEVVERYEVPMADRLTLPVVKMRKQF